MLISLNQRWAQHHLVVPPTTNEVTVNYTGLIRAEAQFSADIDFQTGNNQPDITNVLFGDPSDSSLGPAELVDILLKVKPQNKL